MISRSKEVDRLHSLFANSRLMHPYLSSKYFARQRNRKQTTTAVDDAHDAFRKDDLYDNFVDLSASLSICCGVTPPVSSCNSDTDDGDSSFLEGSPRPNENLRDEIQKQRLRLASEIGGSAISNGNGNGNGNNVSYSRRHIILILCDGMGNSILENALNNDPTSTFTPSDLNEQSFFMRNNQPSRLRAVFPSTTPAALTTLATAAWPGRHGMPGWNLRDKKGCDVPGPQNEGQQPVQLLVLSDHIRDARSGELASDMGFETWDEIFVELPWARKLHSTGVKTNSLGRRKMIYVNAYNGDDFQNWVQGDDDNVIDEKQSGATDFSSWFIGENDTQQDSRSRQSSLFETAKIEETSYDTLGNPQGSADATQYFRHGINVALSQIANAERSGESTFIYLYTAHPDKHMHALGVEHEEVTKVVRGIEMEVERFWNVLGDRKLLLSGQYDDIECNDNKESRFSNIESRTVDAAVLVTADHGHITVHEDDMLVLPQNISDLLEYACIGVHGKGRHGYLHCRAGLHMQLQRRWHANLELNQHFLLLTVEDAIENGLFGPGTMRVKVRPRLGDFIAISCGKKTLVTTSEANTFRKTCQCQGSHGSLLPEEMSIPLILLLPDET